MIILIIILIILVIFLIYRIEPYQPNDVTINIMDIKTDDKVLIIIRNMLKDINDLFEKNGITYWIDGGTLLGAVRHQDIIPWDDDADISVLKEHEDKLLSIEPILIKMGYGLSKFWGGYKIFPLNGQEINYMNRNWNWSKSSKDIQDDETFNYKYPFIDVFIVGVKDGKYHYSDEKVRRVWPKFYHERSDLLPLKQYKFGHFYLPGPKEPKPYLDRAYGNDWLTVAYKQYDHLNQKIFDKIKFNI